MSDQFSTSDWIRHLHVQVAMWEERDWGKRCRSCRRIEAMTHCLSKRLGECKGRGLVPHIYCKEIDMFFEFLKHPKIDTKRISKLVKIRNKTILLLNIFCRYCHLSDNEKQETVDKLEQTDIETLSESVKILIHILTPFYHIQSLDPLSEEKINRVFNDTTWLRHMFRMFVMIYNYNSIQPRVRWRDVQNGVDPNNPHNNPVNGEKEKLTKAKMKSELQSLVPLCKRYHTMPRPYEKEIQLLTTFLHGGELDKKRVQKEEKTRVLAIELKDIMMTMLTERYIRNEVVRKIPSSKVGDILQGLNDLERRLLCTVTTPINRESLIEHQKEDDNNPSFNRGSFEDLDDKTDEEACNILTLPNKQSLQLEFENGNAQEGTVKLAQTGNKTGDVLHMEYDTENIDILDDDIMVDPSTFDDNDILDQSFHDLLQAASSESYFDYCLTEYLGAEQKTTEDDDNFEVHPENFPSVSSASTSFRSCSNICTQNTSHTSSDLTNEDNVFEVWSGVGDVFIKTVDSAKLLKIQQKVADFGKLIHERLQQTKPD